MMSRAPKDKDVFVAQHENARMCIRELFEEMKQIENEELRSSLERKLENLEESIFEKDEWARADRHGLKVAVLGVPHAGQAELLQRFINGEVQNGEDGAEQGAGHKQSTVSIGKRHKTTIQCNGRERDLLLRTALGDPGPQVLKWADAYLLVFQVADDPSTRMMQSVFKKICRYRRKTGLPCYFVQINNVDEIDGRVSDELAAIEAAVTVEDGSFVDFVQANPFSGHGVMSLFNGMAQKLAVEEPKARGRLRTMAGRRPSSTTLAASAEPDPREQPILQQQFRKHHQHGGHADRWVTLLSDKITYYSTHKDYTSRKSAGKDIPLQSACVKTPMQIGNQPSKEGPCFEIRLLDNRRWKFQAADTTEMKQWEQAIQRQIEAGIAKNLSAGAKNAASITETKKYHVLSEEDRTSLRAVNGNDRCADCTDPQTPTWASLNLTATFCITCSGVHRNLGVHISRVRSLELDDWKADHLAIMMAYGNGALNAVYEAAVPPDRKRPKVGCPSDELEAWIRDKYQHKKFLAPINGDSAEYLLKVISDGGDREERLSAVAHCTKEDINRTDHNESGQAALHVAAARGDLHMVQLLLWAHADPNVVDKAGRTPLQCAREAHATNPKGCDDTAELLASQDATIGSRLIAQKKSARGRSSMESATPEIADEAEVGGEAACAAAAAAPDNADAVSALADIENGSHVPERPGVTITIEETAVAATEDGGAQVVAENPAPIDAAGADEDDGYIQALGTDDVEQAAKGVADLTAPASERPSVTFAAWAGGETSTDAPAEADTAVQPPQVAVAAAADDGAGVGSDTISVQLKKEAGRKLEFSIKSRASAVVVTKSSPGGLAWANGIRMGMKVLQLNGEVCQGKKTKELLTIIASNDVVDMVLSAEGVELDDGVSPTDPEAEQKETAPKVSSAAEPLESPPPVNAATEPVAKLATPGADGPSPVEVPAVPPIDTDAVPDLRAEIAKSPSPVTPWRSSTADSVDFSLDVAPSEDVGAAKDASGIMGDGQTATIVEEPAAGIEPSVAELASEPAAAEPSPAVEAAPTPEAAPEVPRKIYTDKEARHEVKALLRAHTVHLWLPPYTLEDGSSGLTDEMIAGILTDLPPDVPKAQGAAAVRYLRQKSVARKERKNKK
mmetsp:Transcript_28184/g.84316  ORF Transcript_28184/g.84316 Transcript_28184/m.84316 type:complete len:1134 (-) Transcript_28184:56-3457(-)